MCFFLSIVDFQAVEIEMETDKYKKNIGLDESGFMLSV